MNLFIILYLINFLRTIFIIVIIYFGIRLVARYVLPLLIDKSVKNMQQKMHDQQKQNQQQKRPEGDVTIETNQNKNRNRQNEGEYVDFEEVD